MKLEIRYVTWLLTWFAGILCRFCCVGPLPFHVKYGRKPHVYAPSSCRSIRIAAVLWSNRWWNVCSFLGVKAKAYYSIFKDIWYCEKNSTWSFCKHVSCFFLFPQLQFFVLCSLTSSIIRFISFPLLRVEGIVGFGYLRLEKEKVEHVFHSYCRSWCTSRRVAFLISEEQKCLRCC